MIDTIMIITLILHASSYPSRIRCDLTIYPGQNHEGENIMTTKSPIMTAVPENTLDLIIQPQVCAGTTIGIDLHNVSRQGLLHTTGGTLAAESVSTQCSKQMIRWGREPTFVINWTSPSQLGWAIISGATSSNHGIPIRRRIINVTVIAYNSSNPLCLNVLRGPTPSPTPSTQVPTSSPSLVDWVVFRIHEACENMVVDERDSECDGDLDCCKSSILAKGFNYVVWWQNECYGSLECDRRTVLTGAKIHRPANYDVNSISGVDKQLLLNTDGYSYYMVPVAGAMLNINVARACKTNGMKPLCPGPDGCEQNDQSCLVTPLSFPCSSPMQALSETLCAGANPDVCPQLDSVFSYMKDWRSGSACGVINNTWCAEGKTIFNGYALCVNGSFTPRTSVTPFPTLTSSSYAHEDMNHSRTKSSNNILSIVLGIIIPTFILLALFWVFRTKILKTRRYGTTPVNLSEEKNTSNQLPPVNLSEGKNSSNHLQTY